MLSDLPAILTLQEAAKFLRVSELTIRRWIRDGILEAIQPTGRLGHYRIKREEIERLMAGKEQP